MLRLLLPQLILLILILHLPSTRAEHRRFDGPINAASNYIHYSEGYVVTPGYVDISELVFEAVGEAGQGAITAVGGEGYDHYLDDGVEYDDDGGERRRLEDNEKGGVETVRFVVQIPYLYSQYYF